ncbi:hypothetical protein [Neomoorella mulderi]|uniref:Metallo-beta-lactamase domain-containing protein n=1 Tax=Moorella mulderi DSM 14980 TaxID=1122241 RepID=A0A151AYF0_9FIRM|nr:hypothetical protein [Moorella mulderi]KYH32684.1 hypothetical protein MOMUL_12860 [Moorella mulderi DSM 14980]
MSNFQAIYQFHFHNVGQGLFYTGQIEDFLFVYDCGSRSLTSVVRAIDRWFSMYSSSKSTIDVLVISHLDNDHVSGLDYLLGRMSAKLVIMPYVSHFERMLLALRATRVPDWYVSFIKDPVDYLLGTQKIARIILVLPAGEEYEREGLAGPFRENDFANEHWEFRDELWRVLEPMLEEEKEETRQRWRTHLSGGKLRFRTHHGRVVPVAEWEFRFFVQKVEDSCLQKFRDCLHNLCNASELQEILRCKSKRNRVRKCYKYIIGTNNRLNATSLVLYHGPLNRARSITVECSNNIVFSYYPLRYCNAPEHCPGCLATLLSTLGAGQLLMGDLDLTKNYNDFSNHMRSELQSTALCLLPHHGSENSWEPTLMNDASKCHLWVASAGINNKRNRHPSPLVIHDILKNGNAFFWVNELTGLSLVYC